MVNSGGPAAEPMLPRLARSLRRTRIGRAVLRVVPDSLQHRLWHAAADQRTIAASYADPATRQATIADALSHVRQLLDAGHTGEARSYAGLLLDRPEARDLGLLLRGVVADREHRYRLARASFDEVSELALAHAPGAAINATFRCDTEAGVRLARELVETRPASLTGPDWFGLLANLYGNAEPELVAAVFANAEALADGNAALGRRLDWVRPWIGATTGRSAPPVPAGHVSFATIDYRQPGPDGGASSRNIGDWAQTLASLGHLVRHQGLRFHGDPDLTALLEELQQRVRPELRLDTAVADVHVRIMQRDASSYQEFPPDTWALVFGWFMHPLFDLNRHDFPLHPNLQPIFVSFHCAKKDMLTDAAIDYLREHAPIGCRDWTTVDILLSLDIPAFFSGCVTTTINTVFPDLDAAPRHGTLYVDASRSPVPEGVENVRQSLPEVLTNSFEQNVRAVIGRIDRWRADYTRVETSRLHVYLPCRSVGLETRYEPDSFSDPRVNGLLPLTDSGFEAIRTGIRDLLQPVYTAVLSGAPAGEVRALWRDLTAEAVDVARRRHDAPGPAAEPSAELAAARRTRPQPSSGGLDVVYVPRPAERRQLPLALRATLRRLPADAAVWVVADELPSGVHDPRVHLVQTSGIVPESAPAASRRDRVLALLPELLPADRVIVLPVASVVDGDLRELVELDLEGQRVAARRSTGALASGSQALFRVARGFDRDVERANELLRETFRRHAFDFSTIDAELLVLDLSGLRADATTERLLDSMDRYGLSWPNALLFEFGAGILPLDPAWARVPTRDPEDAAKAWVWLDSPKPWSDTSSIAQRWRDAARSGPSA